MSENPITEAQELAIVLRNLKCEVEIDIPENYYSINGNRYYGLYSFISAGRRALKLAKVIP